MRIMKDNCYNIEIGISALFDTYDTPSHAQPFFGLVLQQDPDLNGTLLALKFAIREPTKS